METTVSTSVLRLALQLVLLIAAVRGQPWCSPDLNTVEPGSEEVEFQIINVTCDSNTNNPEVKWIANGVICWGYSCNDGQAQGLIPHCAGGGSFAPSAKVVLKVADETQCSYYPCIQLSSNFLEYRINYTVSCPADTNPQPTSSTALLQYLNSTAVTTPSHTPGEVTTQHTMQITFTTLIPSTMPSTQMPTDAQIDTTVIVLSASTSILGVLLIVLLIVLLCSTMFKRYYRKQNTMKSIIELQDSN